MEKTSHQECSGRGSSRDADSTASMGTSSGTVDEAPLVNEHFEVSTSMSLQRAVPEQ